MQARIVPHESFGKRALDHGISGGYRLPLWRSAVRRRANAAASSLPLHPIHGVGSRNELHCKPMHTFVVRPAFVRRIARPASPACAGNAGGLALRCDLRRAPRVAELPLAAISPQGMLESPRLFGRGRGVADYRNSAFPGAGRWNKPGDLMAAVIRVGPYATSADWRAVLTGRSPTPDSRWPETNYRAHPGRLPSYSRRREQARRSGCALPGCSEAGRPCHNGGGRPCRNGSGYGLARNQPRVVLSVLKKSSSTWPILRMPSSLWCM